jgi:hypothetical protein
MTEPRLRAIVSALVAAIAALAFLVSFRAMCSSPCCWGSATWS